MLIQLIEGFPGPRIKGWRVDLEVHMANRGHMLIVDKAILSNLSLLVCIPKIMWIVICNSEAGQGPGTSITINFSCL